MFRIFSKGFFVFEEKRVKFFLVSVTLGPRLIRGAIKVRRSQCRVRGRHGWSVVFGLTIAEYWS